MSPALVQYNSINQVHDYTCVPCVSVKTRHSWGRTLSLSLSSNPFTFVDYFPSKHTPTNFLFALGLMPGQHVAVAQTVTPDIVRVGGRYRMGKLLGAGTFGMSI